MQKLLKQILFIIVALAFYNGASVGQCRENISVADIQNEITAIDCFVSSQQTDICVPRQVSTFTSVRLQSTGRKSDNSYTFFSCRTFAYAYQALLIALIAGLVLGSVITALVYLYHVDLEAVGESVFAKFKMLMNPWMH